MVSVPATSGSAIVHPLDEVLAPREWPNARVEAWLDWAATLPMARSAPRHGDASGSAYDGVGFRAVKRLGE